ncbi:MAG: transporter substrate-binding protein [Chlamydiales bacterium]|jgi:NitT/TauT family transport system substrate-binding protein|nr:transporter substrate-binding protein [Chlamydiales bacterium]
MTHKTSFLAKFLKTGLKLGLCALILFFAFQFFANLLSPQKSSSIDSPKISIAVLPSLDAFPLTLAQQQGFFKDEGIEVELIPFQSAMERDSAFQAKQCDGMTSDLISTALMKNAGIDARITYLTVGEKMGDGRVAILVPPQSNLQSIEELKGKKIGISSNSVIEYITDKILQSYEIKAEEVDKAIVAKIAIRLSMLLENKIAAATLPEPYSTLAEFNGARVIADDKKLNVSQAALVFHQSTIDKEKDTMQRFTRAVNRIAKLINENPDQYRMQAVEYVHMPKEIEDRFRLATYSVNKIPSIENINGVLEWLKTKQLIDDKLSYEDLVTDACLEKFSY